MTLDITCLVAEIKVYGSPVSKKPAKLNIIPHAMLYELNALLYLISNTVNGFISVFGKKIETGVTKPKTLWEYLWFYYHNYYIIGITFILDKLHHTLGCFYICQMNVISDRWSCDNYGKGRECWQAKLVWYNHPWQIQIVGPVQICNSWA